MSEQDAAAWDAASADFDEAADHGLADPGVRAAWAQLLTRSLPAPPARIADLGCGTGSLSVLAADLGHTVDGVDFSPAMLRVARAKADRRTGITFVQGDAASPDLAEGAYDAVLCRHVLWALPDPAAALSAGLRLLRPGGRLVLVEGRWSTGAGLTQAETRALLTAQGLEASVESLDDPRLWGAPISDDRYVAVATTRPAVGR